MKQFILTSMLFLFFACKTPKTPVAVDQVLKENMAAYLNKNPKALNKMHYKIDSVIYFQEAGFYTCEFYVHMKSDTANKTLPKPIDTMGVMKVKMDKNFNVVSRYY
jgi:curli biogenesis system outer membrane secretion channel CsgG